MNTTVRFICNDNSTVLGMTIMGIGPQLLMKAGGLIGRFLFVILTLWS